MLKLDDRQGGAPLLSVFGGKITTARKLAESALEKMQPFFPQMGKPWTASAALPGGDFPYVEAEQRIAALVSTYPFITPKILRRMFRAYGTDAETILGGATSLADLGQSFGPIYEREVEWLRAKEWVRSADDLLWRRSKLGLHMSRQDQDALRQYLATGETEKGLKRAGG